VDRGSQLVTELLKRSLLRGLVLSDLLEVDRWQAGQEVYLPCNERPRPT